MVGPRRDRAPRARHALRCVAVTVGLACTVAASFACRHAAPDAPPATANELGATPLRESMRGGPVESDPLFWRVASRGGAPLHLLGSIHFGPPAGWRQPDAITRAFEQATLLVVEVDDRAISPEQMQALTLRHALLPPGESLADHVSAETLQMLEEHLAKQGSTLADVSPLRPWMISIFIDLNAMARVGLVPETGVDRSYLARVTHQQVIALETAEEQIELLASLQPAQQELALIDAIEQAQGAQSALFALAEGWRRGDEAILVEVIEDSFDHHPELEPMRQAIVVDRNRAMAARLAEIASDPARAGQRAFVVVGTAHLVGRDSIVTLLREAGFEVERLGPTAAAADPITPDEED